MSIRRRLSLSIIALIPFAPGCLSTERGESTVPRRAPQTTQDFLPTRASHQLVHCGITATFAPKSHELDAKAELTLQHDPESPRMEGNSIFVSLNSRLIVDRVELDGASLHYERLGEQTARVGAEDFVATDESSKQPTSAPSQGESAESHAAAKPAEPMPTTTAAASPTNAPTSRPSDNSEAEGPVATHQAAYYRISLPNGRASGDLMLTFTYSGMLWQDIEAGEKAGEIHNFQMSAHIGDEGIYLSPGGYWYPTLATRDDAGSKATERPESPRTNFELTATPPEGFLLTACGERTDADLLATREASTTWKTPFPIDGITLVGGPLEIHQTKVGSVVVSLHLQPEHADKAALLTKAITHYLTLYQPLVGPYPFREFTVVENFFSSGFAFPGYTLLASAVVGMGENGLRPGYLDHEMLHNWWGNGVLVSSRDGNWCECLTSFCANYMRYNLEGKPDDARANRRDTVYGMSGVSDEKNVPIDQFDREGDASRFIGYQKGSMVFAMLADRVGEKALWRSLKRLARERLGLPTTWDDIRTTIERETARPLDQFFKQWVRGAGVPDIQIDDAVFDENSRRLTLTITQHGDSAFDVTLPIRVMFEGVPHQDHRISLSRALQVEILPCSTLPKAIEIDPDFRILRKIPSDHIMPTISRIGRRIPLTVVRDGEDFKAYKGVSKSFRERYEDDSPDATEISPNALTDAVFARGHVLLLGHAARNPRIVEALNEHQVVIGDGYFVVEGKRYDELQHALLCCVNNSMHDGAIVCCYIGNGKQALQRASLLSFYGGDSLIVFDRGKPVQRADFERIQTIPVKAEAATSP